ncbi:RluA family pseudouridine synthase [Actinomycetaceae bacterium TAE3-ERU4]|nr:RluA family pseudouridine synthase [Actinomycetaceae bacterium TAE3-ERU4]
MHPLDSRVVEVEQANQRLDVLLAQWTGLTRSAIGKQFKELEVNVDGKKARKSDSLPAGAVVSYRILHPQEELFVVPTPFDLPVIYEDENILVIDKPAGIAAHPARGFDGPTVVGALMAKGYEFITEGDAYRRGVVHRLDADTSGLMVLARDNDAYLQLQNDFRLRQVDKTYQALVQGHMEHSAGTIDAPIGRARSKDGKMAVRPDGRHAVTHFRVLHSYRGAQLLEIDLETGRTHQIRVHFASLGHPCVGDLRYGANPKLAGELGLKRQWLHASRLVFAHPLTGEKMEFNSSLPNDLEGVLSGLSLL